MGWMVRPRDAYTGRQGMPSACTDANWAPEGISAKSLKGSVSQDFLHLFFMIRNLCTGPPDEHVKIV